MQLHEQQGGGGGGHTQRYCVNSYDREQNAVKVLLRGRPNGQAENVEHL